MTEVAIPAPSSSASGYGAHMLVDFRPIEEADTLLEECKQYIDEAQQELYVVPFAPTFTRFVTNVRQWRMKRKDARLQTVYESLLPRVITCEKELRAIIGDVVEKKGALRLQARHLQVRLNVCVTHNHELLLKSDHPLDETRGYVNLLSDEQTALKQMLVFNTEVNRLKAAEANAKKQQAMRWTGFGKNRQNHHMNNKKNAETAAADLKDEHHGAIEQRLKTCRTLRQKCVGLLAAVLESRGLQQSNVDNCYWALDALKTVVKREGLGPDTNNNNNNSSHYNNMDSNNSPINDNSDHNNTNLSQEEKDLLTFDHSRCSDCAYGYSMATDCISHLAALQKQALDANKRLQSLVEMRERMNEVADAMRVSEMVPNVPSTNNNNNANNSANNNSHNEYHSNS